MSERLTDEQVAEGLRLAEEIDSDRYACTPEESDLAVLALALQERLQAAETRDRQSWAEQKRLAKLVEEKTAAVKAAEAERDTRITDLVDEVDRLKAERDEAREETERARDHFLDRIVDVHRQARREAFEEAAKLKCEMCACVGAQEDGSGTIESERAGRHMMMFAGTGSRSSFKCQAADIRALAEGER
jgi:histidyl-tRNA synthetase